MHVTYEQWEQGLAYGFDFNEVISLTCLVHYHLISQKIYSPYPPNLGQKSQFPFLPSSASVNFNFNFKLEAEIALFSISPAAPPNHPPVKVYFSAAAQLLVKIENNKQYQHKIAVSA